MWLHDCTLEERGILEEIENLFDQLPRPRHEYSEAMTELFRTRRGARQDHNPLPGSMTTRRSPVAASQRYGT